tara:strand:+ start:53 stop:235 length:183 start_codon:yes stop_codon:yes gene_type:complete
MENQIDIKEKTVTDPAKRQKGTGFKKAKKVMEDKVFEKGDPSKNLMHKAKYNKDIVKKKW